MDDARAGWCEVLELNDGEGGALPLVLRGSVQPPSRDRAGEAIGCFDIDKQLYDITMVLA